MLKALRELGEFVLSIFFDLFELFRMLQVPVVASSTYGAEKVRALQLTALVSIIILIVWAGTQHGPDVDWMTIGVVSALFLSFSAWVVHGFLNASAQYKAKSDLKLDSLSIVLTFNLLVIFVATLVPELNFYLASQEPIGIKGLSPEALHIALLIAPVIPATCVLVANSARYGRAANASSKTLLHTGLFALLNVVLSDIFVYVIFIKTLRF